MAGDKRENGGRFGTAPIHKKVREVIEQHRQSFKPSIKDFGFDKVADIVKALLDHRVFESKLKAKIAFPELFQTSPARDIQRNESENNAARSATKVVLDCLWQKTVEYLFYSRIRSSLSCCLQYQTQSSVIGTVCCWYFSSEYYPNPSGPFPNAEKQPQNIQPPFL
jgi:hypothetical protein